jgi:hypothetical protein
MSKKKPDYAANFELINKQIISKLTNDLKTSSEISIIFSSIDTLVENAHTSANEIIAAEDGQPTDPHNLAVNNLQNNILRDTFEPALTAALNCNPKKDPLQYKKTVIHSLLLASPNMTISTKNFQSAVNLTTSTDKKGEILMLLLDNNDALMSQLVQETEDGILIINDQPKKPYLSILAQVDKSIQPLVMAKIDEYKTKHPAQDPITYETSRLPNVRKFSGLTKGCGI